MNTIKLNVIGEVKSAEGGSGGGGGGDDKKQRILKIFCEGTYADHAHYFDSKISSINSCILTNNENCLISDLDLKIDDTIKKIKPFTTTKFRDLNSEELSYITQVKELLNMDCEYFNSETIVEGFDCKKINCSDWGIISLSLLFVELLSVLGVVDEEHSVIDVLNFVKSGIISNNAYRTNLIIGNFDSLGYTGTEKNGQAFGYLVNTHIDFNKFDFTIFPKINKDLFKLYVLILTGIINQEILNQDIPDMSLLDLKITIINPIYLHLEEIKEINSSITLEKLLLDESFTTEEMISLSQYIGSCINV